MLLDSLIKYERLKIAHVSLSTAFSSQTAELQAVRLESKLHKEEMNKLKIQNNTGKSGFDWKGFVLGFSLALIIVKL